MLRNINIRMRLLLGFGVVVMFLIIVGVLSIQKITMVHKLQDTFYKHPFTVVDSLRGAHAYIIKMQLSEKEAPGNATQLLRFTHSQAHDKRREK